MTELIKALRWLAKVRICETKIVDCNSCEFHGFCADPDSDESIADQIIAFKQAADALERLTTENRTLRNELCLKCGQYKTAHLGGAATGADGN